MGTWDDGIYDNDGALDELGRLVKIDEEGGAVRLITQIGLLAWLNPVSVANLPDAVQERLDGFTVEDLKDVPDSARVALTRLLGDTDKGTRMRARSKAALAVIGGYSDGPRIRGLLTFPGAEVAIAALAERAAGSLDEVLAQEVELAQVASKLAALGVLIELKDGGFWTPDPARVNRWREGFVAVDKRTTEERKFWGKYVRNVKKGLDLLAPAGKAAKPAKPVKPAAPAAPVRRRPAGLEAPPVGGRWLHQKFGFGTLVARSGGGPSETLELKFDDGTTRQVLARFVVPTK